MTKKQGTLILVYTKRPRLSWWQAFFSLRWFPPRPDPVQPGEQVELVTTLNRWFRPHTLRADPRVAEAFLLKSFTIDGEPQLPGMHVWQAMAMTSPGEKRGIMFDWCAPGREVVLSLRNTGTQPLSLAIVLAGDLG